MVLNNIEEVRVGDRIIKYLRNHKIGIVHNLNQNALNKLRENSVLANHKDLEFFNRQTNVFYFPLVPPPPPPPINKNSCSVLISDDVTLDINGDYKTINLELNALGTWISNNNNGVCTYSYEVLDWGDGTASSFGLSDNQDHTYNNLNIAPGNSQNIFISVKANKLNFIGNCSLCPTSKTWTVKVNLTNPLPGCINKDHSNSDDHFFSHNGKDYQMKMTIGQQPETSFWSFNWNEKIWAETTFYRKVGGSYKRRTPPFGLITELDGFHYLDCATETPKFKSSGNKRRKSRSVQHKIQQAFGTIDTQGSTKKFKSNHKAEMNHNSFESVNGFLLFP